jgi:hypothetical protein
MLAASAVCIDAVYHSLLCFGHLSRVRCGNICITLLATCTWSDHMAQHYTHSFCMSLTVAGTD